MIKNLQGTNFSDLNRLQRQSLAGALGVNVADLVDGVSKLDKLSFSTKEEADAANL